MAVFDVARFKILCESTCETVGVVHRSRGGWGRGVALGPRFGFRVDFRYGGWGHGVVFRYVGNFNRGISTRFKFRVGMAVGVR